MAVNETLQVRQGDGWWRGLDVLLRKENGKVWGSYRWLLYAVVWLVVVNGLLALILFFVPQLQSAADGAALPGDRLDTGVQAFFGVGGMAIAIGVIVMAQDTVIGEKLSGTAEWLLSKPVSRSAFVLAKLIAYSAGALVILVLLQGLVAYGLLSLVGTLAPASFLAGLGILALHTFFYLALTLVMGVLVDNRGLLLGVTLASLLGGQLLLNLPAFLWFTPWGLPNMATAVTMGAALPAQFFVPLLVTALWCVLFVGLALWRFRHLEF